MLTDFLKPNVRKIKLLSHLAPIKTFKNDSLTNLDLNTTARKEMKKIQVLNNYLDCQSYLVITLDIAHEIKEFVV